MAQKAVILASPGKAEVRTDWEIPTTQDDCILVKVISVALNPSDWKHIDYLAPSGVTVGCDYAGIVQEVGKNVTRIFRKGDRIAGFTHGSNPLHPGGGAFAEYAIVKGDLQLHVPEHLTFQEAATLGAGIQTIGQGLYQSLNLARPSSPLSTPVPILIYGGSTATGTLAIQFAKASGYQVVTTASPHNFALLKTLGADACFDYHDACSPDNIRRFVNDKLELIFDTISTESSAKFCAEVMSPNGGQYGAILKVTAPRADILSHFTLAYTIFGEEFRMGPNIVVPAKPGDKAFAQDFLLEAERLLANGAVRPHPLRVGENGLKGVLEGLDLLRAGKVSAEKLVYNVADTPETIHL